MAFGNASGKTAVASQDADWPPAGFDTAGGQFKSPRSGPPFNRSLKNLLKGLDLFSLALGWMLAYRVIGTTGSAGTSDTLPLLALGLTGVVTSLVVMATKRLWLARVCAVRSAELEGLGQTAVITALVVLAAGQLTDYNRHDRYALVGALSSFILMIFFRAWYAWWLKRARRAGRYARRLVLVGTNGQSFQLASLIAKHPETGFDIVGVCGPRDATGQAPEMPWLGDYRDAAAAISDADANGALVVASALNPTELNHTLRSLLNTGCHVHVSSALSGISHERLLPLPLAREPLFYVEHTSLTRSQLAVKRLTDLCVATVLMLAMLPLLVALAIAIKLNDGGPVLFRQRRVGRLGKPFTLYKLRTMVPDAEKRQSELVGNNERTGPLFKVVHDPRVTRIGWWLRATSLDELPQLFNVLRGEMSLVGPRPALPQEVAQFDQELQQRGRMLPGITGLWQVEARDDPSFDSYRRLDLYYVDNWSIGLDLAIIGTTAGAVAGRALREIVARSTAS